MQPLPRSLLASARDNHGLIVLADMSSTMSRRQRQVALDTGQIVTVHRGVYRLASHPPTFDQRCLAACLAAPDAALSGPTCGRLMGLRRVAASDVHLIAKRALRLEGVVAHRTNLLSEHDIVTRGALRILRPARLACDLARFLDDDDLESVIEQLLDRRAMTIDTVRKVARDFMTSGRDGTRRLARVLDTRPTWRRPVGSDLELRLLRALTLRGLQIQTQVPVLLDDARRVLIDLADPTIRFGVEVDHVTWHGGRLDAQQDKIRDRSLMKLGWTIARVTDDDIEHRLDTTADELVSIAALRRRAA